MPRLNIADIWFDDPRRTELGIKLKSTLIADGVALSMWRLAQTYFRVGLLVPVDQYKRMPFYIEFQESGLAEYFTDGVYIKGRDDAFDWIRKKQESGRKGGKVKPKSELTRGQSKRKQTQAKTSKRKLNTHTHINTLNKYKYPKNCFNDLCGLYPSDAGHQGARSEIRKQITNDVKLQKLFKAVTNYAAICKRENTEMRYIKHFSTFMKNPKAGHDVFPWKDYVDMDPTISGLSAADKEFLDRSNKKERT